MTRRILIPYLIITLSLIAGLTISCSKKTPMVRTPEVIAVNVKVEDLSKIKSVVGQVDAMEQVELQARVKGFLTKRNFMPGQYVTKGQLLFEIQKDQYQADLLAKTGDMKQVQAQLDFLTIEYNRTKLLYSQNAISQEKFQLSESALLEQQGKLESAKARYQLALLNMSYTDILSPFNGRIGMYQYSVGNMVGMASKPLAVVTQVDPIWVSFNYSEALFESIIQEFDSILPSRKINNFNNVSNNVKVMLQLSNGTTYPLTGKIDYISNLIDAATGTIQIRAVFPNPKEELIAGAYVQVKLSTNNKTPCMLLPQSAFQEDQAGPFVFTINKNNIVEQKYVKLGMSVGENVVVTSGINEKDLVISQGVLKVRPGVTVKYTMQKSVPDTVTQNNNIESSSLPDSNKAPAK